MKTKITNLFKPDLVLLIVMLILLSLACETTEPLFDHFNPEGEYILNWDELPSINESEGMKLGGFSGLYYKSGRIFYTITDRGPVIQNLNESGSTTCLLQPGFAPCIVKLELQDDQTMKVIETKSIITPSNRSASGLIPQSSWMDDEIFTNQDNVVDDWGIYPGGILMDVANNFFWFADQYQPALYQTTVEGQWVKRIRPAEGMRRAFGKHTVNGGLTGIDFTAEGYIITVMGRCLEDNRAPEDNSSPINYRLRRIGLVDVEHNSDLSMFYLVEPESYDGIPPQFITLGDIKTVNDTSYLVTEYGNYNGTERNLLYMISVADTTTKALVGLEGINGQTFETLSYAAWKANKIYPVNKILLLDLKGSAVNCSDGIAILDSEHVAVLNNNKYGIVNGDPNSRQYQLDKQPIKIKIFKLPTKLDIKQL